VRARPIDVTGEKKKSEKGERDERRRNALRGRERRGQPVETERRKTKKRTRGKGWKMSVSAKERKKVIRGEKRNKEEKRRNLQAAGNQ